MTDECGLSDLAPRMWTERIVAEIPDKGYTIERQALFQDLAPGVSFWGFTESANPQVIYIFTKRRDKRQGRAIEEGARWMPDLFLHRNMCRRRSWT